MAAGGAVVVDMSEEDIDEETLDEILGGITQFELGVLLRMAALLDRGQTMSREELTETLSGEMGAPEEDVDEALDSLQEQGLIEGV